MANGKPRLRFKSFIIIVGTIALLGFGYWYWRWSRTEWIPAGHVGVIYDASSGLQGEVISPRAVQIGWRQKLYIYPTQLQAAIYTQDENEGEVKAADGILITTTDNANTIFDVIVFYRVKKEDVVTVFKEFGPIPIEQIQITYIRRAAKEAVNSIGTHYDVFELMGTKREEASRLITEEMKKRMEPKGLTIESVMLGGSYPTPEIQSKINSRVNSYTELEISRLRKSIAEIEREKAVIQAQAQNDAQKLTSEQAVGKSVELLKLQAAEEAVKKWNGQLPPIQSRPGQTVIIGKELLQQGGNQ